jgi:hypothetical protein
MLQRFIATAIALGFLGVASCSDDDSDRQMTCDEMRARVAEIEASPPSEGQSWDDIQEVTELSIERDALRVHITYGC